MSCRDSHDDNLPCSAVSGSCPIASVTFNGIEFVPRLRWTTEKPTKEPGYYWYRPFPNVSAHIVEFYGEVDNIREYGGEWAGPIPLPAEPDPESRR